MNARLVVQLFGESIIGRTYFLSGYPGAKPVVVVKSINPEGPIVAVAEKIKDRKEVAICEGQSITECNWVPQRQEWR